MYWGLLGVGGVAFSCSTEFIPELNEKLRLVPFTSEFKSTMTTVMLVDFVACYVIEKVLKHLFSDFRPKDIALRRPDQIQREEKRKADEIRAKESDQATDAYAQLEEDKKIVNKGVL